MRAIWFEMMKRFATIVLLGALALLPVSCATRVQTTSGVNLLAIADWGMLNREQKTVADGMAKHVSASGRRFDAVLTGGDNIYIELKSAADPLWGAIFERMYDSKILSFPFYISPGNHDYEHGKIPIQLEYSRRNPTSRWKFPAPFYRVDLPAGAEKPVVTVLMLDSNKDQMGEHAWNAQLAWLERELAAPRDGAWMIAVAHHPLFSNGDHGDNGVLQRTWGELFKKHGLDLFIAGHDHDLQHLEVPGWKTSFILVGGGGASVRTMRVDRRGPFSTSSYGFADMNITPEKLTVQFIDPKDQTLHAFERSRSGEVRLLKDGASDVAVPRTPRSINRP